MNGWRCLECQATANPLSSAERCDQCGGVLTRTAAAAAKALSRKLDKAMAARIDGYADVGILTAMPGGEFYARPVAAIKADQQHSVTAASDKAIDTYKYQFTKDSRLSIPDLFPVTEYKGGALDIVFGKPVAPRTTEARAIETDTDEQLRDRLRRLLADNRALSEANAAYESNYKAIRARNEELCRQLDGDPAAKQTRNDLRADRDHWKSKATGLESDLAWHKRELARGRKR